MYNNYSEFGIILCRQSSLAWSIIVLARGCRVKKSKSPQYVVRVKKENVYQDLGLRRLIADHEQK